LCEYHREKRLSPVGGVALFVVVRFWYMEGLFKDRQEDGGLRKELPKKLDTPEVDIDESKTRLNGFNQPRLDGTDERGGLDKEQ
jgi:hypothetical protein